MEHNRCIMWTFNPIFNEHSFIPVCLHTGQTLVTQAEYSTADFRRQHSKLKILVDPLDRNGKSIAAPEKLKKNSPLPSCTCPAKGS